jgi:hypothetical protein
MKKLISFTFIFFLLSFILCKAAVRYVSHSGSNTPPYLTWETAADSIQKCIDYSSAGDTIIVANGTYKEMLVINTDLHLWGTSMDSTVIDSRGLFTSEDTASILVHSPSFFEMKNFHIIGTGREIIYQWFDSNNMSITYSRIENGSVAIVFFGEGINEADDLILKGVDEGVGTGDLYNTATYITKNNLMLISALYGYGIMHSGGGMHEITNNIILFTDPTVSSGAGIEVVWGGRMHITNNIVAGFRWWHFFQDEQQLDSAFIVNNVFGYSNYNNPLSPIIDLVDGRKTVKNNIILRSSSGKGIRSYNFTLNPDYNLYWDLAQKYQGLINPGQHEITSDPMLIEDKFPDDSLTFNYHLQAYSPAIDAGDPNIPDLDGSRSDIGAFGGPGGERYLYPDLPPRTPVNLEASSDSFVITLTWNRNTEADTAYYNVYRDTIPDFTIDSTKLISSQSDTLFLEPVPRKPAILVYKVTAVDRQGNQSLPSEEKIIQISSTGGKPVIQEDSYILYQNYPNPFNPSTKIGYKLKTRGYVKLMVYDIKGEVVKVLVNEQKEAGYYETEFYGSQSSPFSDKLLNQLASGIYLYRIEITGKGAIPVYSETKKMMFLK